MEKSMRAVYMMTCEASFEGNVIMDIAWKLQTMDALTPSKEK